MNPPNLLTMNSRGALKTLPMQHTLRLLAALLLAPLAALHAVEPSKPNIILINCDDLGYGDLRLLRREGYPHAAPRPHGGGRHAVHGLLRDLARSARRRGRR